MSFLNNTGLATQINIIKAYVQSQINAATALLNNSINITAASLNTSIAATIPTGTVQAFAGSVVPEGWLLCDGSAISRTTYAALFNIIGNTYGSGDGETTFNLPDLIDKFIEGSTAAGTEKAAGLPNITGQVISNDNGYYWGAGTAASGAFYDAHTGGSHIGADSWTGSRGNGFIFNASRSSSIYGNSTTVQPPAVTMKYIIKY